MARDGNGDFSRSVTPPSNGDVADADDFNAEMNDIADALSDSINVAGTKAMGANWSMGGFRITNVAAPTSDNDSARKKYVDDAISGLSSVYEAKDADLTAIAALGYTSGSYIITKTAADTWALASISANALSFNAAANYAAMRTALGVAIGSDVQAYDADTAFIDQSQTWTGTPAFNAATAFTLSNARPSFRMSETDQAADEKTWEIAISAADFRIATLTDAGGFGASALTINRGSGTAVGSADFAGAITAGGNTVLTDATGAQLAAANIFTNTNRISNTGPRIDFHETDASTDEKYWSQRASSGNFVRSTSNDSISGEVIFELVQRTGTNIDEIDWTADLFDMNGDVDISGELRARIEDAATTSGTLTAADANTTGELTGNITVPASVFAKGDKIRRYMGASSRTLTQGSGLTLRLAGTSTTGSRTGTARGWVLFEFISATECVVSGDVS